MTVFDVRLGWWLANPAGAIKKWRIGSPTIGFYWLLCELFGATTDDSEYLYLSDGGHFENLGIYELVRRRCKIIVACDASGDALYGCSDLHNAMERCRVDFGAEIEITADEIGKITPAGAPPRAMAHFATGLIRYTPGNPADDGILIYVKPALQASDSADLLGYSRTNPAFPHDSTVDQWFDESHFENYRALGEPPAGRPWARLETLSAHCSLSHGTGCASTSDTCSQQRIRWLMICRKGREYEESFDHYWGHCNHPGSGSGRMVARQS